MQIDVASLALGVGIACIVQIALNQVAFKIMCRVMSSAVGKRASLQAFHDALLKLGDREP